MLTPVMPGQVEVYTSAWTVTHDPQYFHEPMSFKPERWLDPDCKDVKEASQPFSLGPRGCLGRKSVFPSISNPSTSFRCLACGPAHDKIKPC